MSFTAKTQRTPRVAKEIFDLAATIHDTADAILEERDVEGDEQSKGSFERLQVRDDLRNAIVSIPIKRPRPTRACPQGVCLDKGYDYREVEELLREFRFTGHIARRGHSVRKLKRNARHKAHRWVVERTHSWMNRFRRILVRWEKRADTYVALLHLAFALITWRSCAAFA